MKYQNLKNPTVPSVQLVNGAITVAEERGKRVRLGPLSRSGSAAAIAPVIISLRFIGCMNTWNMPLNKKR